MLPGVDAVPLSAGNLQWSKVKKRIADIRMPHPNSRAALFSRIFADNERVVKEAQRREHPPDETLYTLAALQDRNPDFIAVHSGDYAPPIEGVRKYYDDLLNERFPYRKVFELASPPVPWWTYPREIDFLRLRFTILGRAEATTR